MKKRDKQRERREVIHALSMILQIGLAMLTCMGISLAIGYYLDQLLGTKIWVIIMLVIGVDAQPSCPDGTIWKQRLQKRRNTGGSGGHS